MSTRPITDSPRTASTRHCSYYLPEKVCATCGQSSKNSAHPECRRDHAGRLLVRDA